MPGKIVDPQPERRYRSRRPFAPLFNIFDVIGLGGVGLADLIGGMGGVGVAVSFVIVLHISGRRSDRLLPRQNSRWVFGPGRLRGSTESGPAARAAKHLAGGRSRGAALPAARRAEHHERFGCLARVAARHVAVL